MFIQLKISAVLPSRPYTPSLLAAWAEERIFTYKNQSELLLKARCLCVNISTNFLNILYFPRVPFMVYYAPCSLLYCFIRPSPQPGPIACGLCAKRNLKCVNKSSSFLCALLLMLGFVRKVHRVMSERRMRVPKRRVKNAQRNS